MNQEHPQLLPYFMAKIPIVLTDKKEIKSTLKCFDQNTLFEIHGNNIEVYYVDHISDDGYECIRINGLYDHKMTRCQVSFDAIPKAYMNVVQEVGFLLAVGIYIYIPSRACVSQLGKFLKMGKSGDILRIGAPWLETSILMQRALNETTCTWKAVIRTDGPVNRISSAISKDSPNHSFHILRMLCDEPVDTLIGKLTEQKVSLKLTYRDRIVQISDSVTGQAALRVESNTGFTYVKSHHTKITEQEKQMIVSRIHNELFRRNNKSIAI